MIARNSSDFIKPCLESVLPHVKKVIVTIDSNSTDGTEQIVREMTEKYPHLLVNVYPVTFANYDLVKMRNLQIAGTEEDWIWIVDSDEFYPPEVIKEIDDSMTSDFDCLAIMSWAIWSRKEHHVSTSKIPAGRVFRRLPNMKWEGSFGKEKLYSGSYLLWEYENPRVKYLEGRYIHMTHVKADHWREEMGQVRRADGRNIGDNPPEIINYINKIYDKND